MLTQSVKTAWCRLFTESEPSLPLPWKLSGRMGSERLRHRYQPTLFDDKNVEDDACAQGDR